MSRAPEANKELLGKLRAGDKDALGELFSAYRGHLHCMIDLRLDPRLNGRVSSSDILQDVYI